MQSFHDSDQRQYQAKSSPETLNIIFRALGKILPKAHNKNERVISTSDAYSINDVG